MTSILVDAMTSWRKGSSKVTEKLMIHSSLDSGSKHEHWLIVWMRNHHHLLTASFVAEKHESNRFVSMSRSPVDEDDLVSLINDIVRILLLTLNHELNTVIISEYVAWCVSWTRLLEHQLIFCCVRSKAGWEQRVFVDSIDSTQSNVVPGRDDS